MENPELRPLAHLREHKKPFLEKNPIESDL